MGEHSTKFEAKTKKQYAEEAAGKAALNKKKETFKKKCAERKVKMRKEEEKQFSKMEQANKELCSKTRKTSEANNKKSVRIWESTVSKLEGHCKAAQQMEVEKRKKFVHAVCTAIRSDVESTVVGGARISVLTKKK